MPQIHNCSEIERERVGERVGENIVHTIPYNRISDTMHVIKTEKMKTNENGTAKEQEKHIVREKLDKLPWQLEGGVGGVAN